MVIGADQTLALGARRFSKAGSPDEARANLAVLRGETHQLHSGVALARDGVTVFADVATADMTMRAFSDAFLDAYLARVGDRVLLLLWPLPVRIGGHPAPRADRGRLFHHPRHAAAAASRRPAARGTDPVMIRACCIGWPIQHVRSPLIHGFWLKTYGIDGDYTREAVEPGGAADFLRSLADRGFAGCNVTIPHKEAAFAAMDEVEPGAVAVGAVNTVWHDAGRLIGMNSDVTGFLRNLDEQVPGWDGEVGHAVVLGAGGAARGIVHGLLSRGVEVVTLAN